MWDPPGLNANASTVGVFDDDDDDDESRGDRVIIGIESDLREEEEDVGDIGGGIAIGTPVAEIVDDDEDEGVPA